MQFCSTAKIKTENKWKQVQKSKSSNLIILEDVEHGVYIRRHVLYHGAHCDRSSVTGFT